MSAVKHANGEALIKNPLLKLFSFTCYMSLNAFCKHLYSY